MFVEFPVFCSSSLADPTVLPAFGFSEILAYIYPFLLIHKVICIVSGESQSMAPRCFQTILCRKTGTLFLHL